jgi:F-type H+-transporting ATPase subunit alpha
VFYLHARLLERAAKLSPERGGGSLTALPIAETDAGNLSAYIPTNLISITDGQLVLDAKLFHAGHKPAVDVGTSVSRVGGKTQAPALRDATAMFRLEYAQFLELEMFTRFGGLSDTRVKARVARGERLRALLSQPQYAPLRLADEVALAIALGEGLLDPIATDAIAGVRWALPAWLDRHAGAVVEKIGRERQIDHGDRELLLTVLRALVARHAAVAP